MTNFKEQDGWQIYKEPKPEPIFTTGDKVTDGVIEGTIIHIEDAIADVCPSTDEYKIELRNLNHIPESPKQDDVEKPLRSMIAEAKAIGKNIRTYYQDIVFTPQALEACLDQGKFRWWNICNWELTTREQNYYPISTSSDRQKPDNLYLNIKPSNPADWCFDKKNLLVLVDNNFKGIVGENVTREQVGEIAKLLTEPAQQYKAGDWVEYQLHASGDNMIGQIICIGRIGDTSIEVLPVGNYEHNSSLSTYHVIYANSIVRKLKPSQVVVQIGCLSGTIGESCEPACFLMWHSSPRMGFDYSIIKLSALDTQTLELVEGLLEAQKEE